MIIRTIAYPRAGLIGNPSDGYFGKTISFVFDAFSARVCLYETPDLVILPSRRDHSVFEGIGALARDVRQFGYYGGIRLLKAAIKTFYDYCEREGMVLDDRNFSIHYETDIPGQVGLAGSSAIITACMRALMAFYGATIPPRILATLVLEVETKELGIPAGLQDRVAQVYEGLVFMDFDKVFMQEHGYGRYEPLDPQLLPPLYIAYRQDLAEGTEVFHNDIRGRFNRGEAAVVDAMKFWADLALQAKELLLAKRGSEIGRLLNVNFDKRRELYRLSQGNIEMVEAARSVGASAKFCGSGGAIVGTFEDDAMFERLTDVLKRRNIRVLRPRIIGGDI
jgi:glucuronokinase